MRRIGNRKGATRINRPYRNIELERARVGLQQCIADAGDDLWLVAELESIFSIFVRNVREKVQRYDRFWKAVFDIVEHETEADVLVDSSKTAWGQIERPRLLQNSGHDVYVLHLVKYPQALVSSRWRRKGPRHGIQSLLGWSLTNWLTWRRYRAWGSRYMISVYDDLARDPENELGEIGRFIGADLLPAAVHLQSELGFDPGLQIGGNAAGRHEKVFWKPKLKCQQDAPVISEYVGAAGTPLFWYLNIQREKQRQIKSASVKQSRR